MTLLRAQVQQFMQMAGQEVRARPGAPDEAVVRLRCRLVLEEAFEFVQACMAKDSPRCQLLDSYKNHAFDVIANGTIGVDLPEAADALADTDYVVEGARSAFGINGDSIAAAVHDANMQKLKGPVDEHGKKQKPEGWKAPDIAACLRAQGWQGL